MTRRMIFDRTIDVPLPDGPREDLNFTVRMCRHCGQSARHITTLNGWRCMMCGRFTKEETKGGE
jgi:DNA-directed RNA polymerase subunit RPC12/RpoP